MARVRGVPRVEFIGTLGERGRDSKIDPYEPKYMKNLRYPGEVRQRAGYRLTYKDSQTMTVSNVIKMLLERSPEFKALNRAYNNFIVQDYILVPDEDGDDSGVAIIEEFIDGMGGKAKFLAVLRNIAYGMFVEGGSCSELINDLDGRAKEIVWVSPWSLAADKLEDEEGEYWVIGQPTPNGQLDPILYDERNPNKYFKYIPTDQMGNDPFGSSRLSGIQASTIALNELLRLMVEYIQGRVFPKKVFQVDLQPLIDMGYEKEEIEQIAVKTEQLIKGILNSADITQDATLSAPIIATLVGGMERSNLDGSEMMVEIFERQIQRGSGLPRSLFATRRTESGWNQNESRIEWGAWDISVESDQVLISDPVTEYFTEILQQNNNQGGVSLKLINNDVEISRIHGEYFQLKVEAYTKLKALNLYTSEELRKKFGDSTKSTFDFSDLESELPEELMQQQQQPQLPPANEE